MEKTVAVEIEIHKRKNVYAESNSEILDSIQAEMKSDIADRKADDRAAEKIGH